MNEIERVARELCKCDGHNPDDLVVPRGLALAWNADGPVIPEGVALEPLWTRYTHFVPVILDAKVEEVFVTEEPEIRDIQPDWRYRYGLAGRNIRTGLPPK